MLIYAAAFVIVVAGMREAASLLVPFLLAAFIAIICAQPLFFLKRKGIPLAVALLIVILGVLCVGLLMAALVGTSIEDFSSSLPFYQESIKEKSAFVISWLEGLKIKVPDKDIMDAFNPGSAMNLVAGMLKGLGGVLTNSFLILLTVIFILLEASSFPRKLRSVLADPDESFGYFDRFISSVQHYMAIKTWISLATGVSIAIWLAILGLDYALLWGLLAFLLNYVPNIGSILAAIPAVLLAMIQFGTGKTLLVALGYVVANVVMGNVVEPRVMGRGMGLSTLVVFLSLVFWGWVLGPVGMLLSVPLTMTLKIALESSEDASWAAVLLGPEVTEEPPQTEAEEEEDAD